MRTGSRIILLVWKCRCVSISRGKPSIYFLFVKYWIRCLRCLRRLCRLRFYCCYVVRHAPAMRPPCAHGKSEPPSAFGNGFEISTKHGEKCLSTSSSSPVSRIACGLCSRKQFRTDKTGRTLTFPWNWTTSQASSMGKWRCLAQYECLS